MTNKKGRLPAYRKESLAMRAVEVQYETADVAQRSVRIITATENPVERWDEERGMIIREVLLMDGIELRPGTKQLPIVDSHDPSTFRNVVGSLRNLRVDGGTFGGDACFSSSEAGQEAFKLIKEGHLTDFSITADILEVRFVERGQSFTTASGMVVQGPANIITRWTPLDASLVATGADPYSKVVRSYRELNRRLTRMDEALLGQLSAMGLPEGMTDPNQVLAWMVGKLSGSPEAEEPEVMESMAEEVKTEELVEKAADEATAPVEEEKPLEMAARTKEETLAQIKRALADDQKRRDEIYAICKLGKVERAYADELCKSFVSVDEARKKVMERMATEPLGTSVEADVRVTGDGKERQFNAMRDGLIKRAYKAARISAAAVDNKDADDFMHVGLNRVAELMLRSEGLNTDRMTATDIAKVAMGNREACRRFKVERAYHTTGSFANLLLDAANKTLLAAYEEAPYTWNLWARQAPSVADFKNINRIRFSESPDPEMIPEKQPYKEKAMADSKESYTVAKYGALFTVSWETVVNDDLDAISRVPAMHGNACRRKVNKEVYSVLTSNPTMGDNVALFGAHTSGTNLSGSNGNPTVGNLNTAFSAMMKQTGLSTDVIISVIPRYLIVPVALAANAEELVSSISYNAANNNEGVRNIYGPGGSRPLTVVPEATLDGNSATAWYLAADPSQIDTVEVSFLQGEESPVLESDWDFDTDVYKYKVRQTFGVKAIDWRGLYKFASA